MWFGGVLGRLASRLYHQGNSRRRGRKPCQALQVASSPNQTLQQTAAAILVSGSSRSRSAAAAAELVRYLAMEDRNAYFRRLNRQHVPTTDGVPDYYLSSVRMFRAAFPDGLPIDSPDYTAVCVFLDHEDYPHRSIAQILDFSFDLGYVDVLNALGFIEDNEVRVREIARVEKLLRPHGLEAWRSEDE